MKDGAVNEGNRNMKKWMYMTLQQKLIALFGLTSVVILAVNIYTFAVISRMMGRVEDVYISNVNLNDLSDGLEELQVAMSDYLRTKTSDAMEQYYRSEQDYRELLDTLNTQVTDNEILLTEKNIYSLSQNYLGLTSEIIQAKRGRNVEKYASLYGEASGMYDEVHMFIYSLNNEQFRNNSATYRALVESLRYMELITVIVLLLVLLGNASLIVMSTKTITEPLKLLAATADEVAKGNFEVAGLPVQQMDEVGIVTGAFNQMVTSIRNYIEQLRQTLERENQLKERELLMQSHLKDAQLKYLQAQINPHFLFNTLNAGAQLAMMEDAEKTEQFLLNVSAFFRYNVRKDDQPVTLGEEIRLVDNYVYIINVRFAGEILFEKDVDESLNKVPVPGMILQPLVENAVNYGVRNIDWKGRIELSVRRTGDHISISVWDNGAGMTKERIRQVLSGELTEEASSGSNGVGMQNVIRRLNLFFDDQAQMDIFSEGQDMGTEVVITIPYAGEEDGYVPDIVG